MFNIEQFDASDAMAGFDPMEAARDRVATELARNMDEELYYAIANYLGCEEFGFSVADVRNRGKFVRMPGNKFEVFYMDSTPLLEIHPVEAIMNGNIITFTRNIKRLYGTEKANT